jgi:hypothetical protein
MRILDLEIGMYVVLPLNFPLSGTCSKEQFPGAKAFRIERPAPFARSLMAQRCLKVRLPLGS